MHKFFIFTQGCKINQYESQAIREAWLRQFGLNAADSPEQADLFLINSCAVTDRAIQDLRKSIRKFNRLRPEAPIWVTGCAAAAFREQIQHLPGVQAIVTQDRKSDLCRLGPESASALESRNSTRNTSKDFSEFCISSYPRARPVLKVQDGCSHCCTYCIVPLTRGPARSRPPLSILNEARTLLDSGYTELVLSGINLAQYKSMTAPQPLDFWDLIRWLDKTLKAEYNSSLRLRLSSLDPALLNSKGLAVLEEAELICPHLHLSIQSASPDVLRAMGRSHYSAEGIAAFIEQVQQFWPLFGLGADFLLGFPGETRADFQMTLDLCSSLPFSYAHIFTFSPRPGTKAAAFPERVEEKEKKQRSQELHSLMREKKQRFYEAILHLDPMHVVLEQAQPGLGLNEYYTLCSLQGGLQKRPGQTVRVKPIGRDEHGLVVTERD